MADKTKVEKAYGGLEYVTVTFRLERLGKRWVIPAAAFLGADREIATRIVEKQYSLRGAEVKFIRKTLGLTYRAFAEPLGLTAPGVQKWERDPKARLSRLTEAALRAFFAERLGIKPKPVTYSEMVRSSESKPVKVRGVRPPQIASAGASASI